MKTLECRAHWMKNKTSLEKVDFAVQQNNNGHSDSAPQVFFKVLIKMVVFDENQITVPGGFTFSG